MANTMKSFSPTPLSGKDTMDRVIRNCERLGLFTVQPEELPNDVQYQTRRGGAIRVGKLVFYASPHDTGCDVRVWVVLEDGQSMQVRSVPYWYGHNYTFNVGHKTDGPWDAAIDAAVEHMKSACRDEQMRRDIETAKAVNDASGEMQAIIDRFAAQFSK